MSTEIPPSVQAMVDDPQAPTAPLNDFLAAMAIDDNWWWRIASGHHLNLFEAAVEERDPIHVHHDDVEVVKVEVCGHPRGQRVFYDEGTQRCGRCGRMLTP